MREKIVATIVLQIVLDEMILVLLLVFDASKLSMSQSFFKGIGKSHRIAGVSSESQMFLFEYEQSHQGLQPS